MRILHAVIILSVLTSGSLQAGEEMEKSSWKGQVSAGLVAISGNSDITTINGKVDVTHDKDKWRHNLNATALNSTSEDVRSAEKYFIALKGDYKFAEQYYAYARVSYEDDKFSGFENQSTLTVGIGRRFLDDIAAMTLDLEAGAGVKSFKPEMMQAETERLIRLSGKYKWEFSNISYLSEDLSVEIGEEFTVTKSVTGLTAKLMDNFALNVSYTVKNTSDVPLGRKETDTETSVNLVYTF